MSPRAMTYKKSGVDVDKANDFVEAIKPYAKATRRPEVMAGIEPATHGLLVHCSNQMSYIAVNSRDSNPVLRA